MNESNSVLQDWVMALPKRAQGGLLVGLRGCDLATKEPDNLESPERQLVAFLRFCVMNPADPREVSLMPGAFFQSEPPREWRPTQFGHYPLHWYTHLMHAFEIVGYLCPYQAIANNATDIYVRMVEAMHLDVETKPHMLKRLTEDRIAAGTVVS